MPPPIEASMRLAAFGACRRCSFVLRRQAAAPVSAHTISARCYTEGFLPSILVWSLVVMADSCMVCFYCRVTQTEDSCVGLQAQIICAWEEKCQTTPSPVQLFWALVIRAKPVFKERGSFQCRDLISLYHFRLTIVPTSKDSLDQEL